MPAMARGRILDRVVRTLGSGTDVVERLAGLPASDLRALLLEVAARRAAARRPADVLRRYEHEVSFTSASVDAAAYRRLEGWAFEALPDGFVEIVLAPHAPLGTSSVLADLSQDRALSTIADSEVVSDSTNVLALEAARRRRDPTLRRRMAPVRLATSHRLLRPRDAAHFGLIGLCTADRDRGSFEMQVRALHEHIDWHLRVITRHAPGMSLEVLLTDLSGGARRAPLDSELLQPMRGTWSAVEWSFDDERQAGRQYYDEACFAIDAVHADGSRANLSDGGLTDWTARLLADGKERLLISGVGSERLLRLR
jgi:hypothetical protein